MKVKVIIGSTRQGRASDKAAQWVVNNLQDKADIELLDLRDYDMPFMNEAVSPQYNPDRKPEGAVKAWLDKLTEAEAVIMVTPEYNRSIPAVLKNAIDQVAYELKGKPVGIVSHGSTGGAQAVSHLRGILPGALATTVPTVVFLPIMAGMVFNEDATFTAAYADKEDGLKQALHAQFDELKKACGCGCKDGTCTCKDGESEK